MVSKIKKVVHHVGYDSVTRYIFKFALPILGVILLFALVSSFFLSMLPKLFPVVIAGMGFMFVIFYPLTIYNQKATAINNKLHLMITYAGTVSIVDISRKVLFTKLSEAKRFGEIAIVSEKILYLAKRWSLGFSTSARRVGEYSPSVVLADFLDRFAVMMDFGQDLKTFLLEEQGAVMDDFEAEYKKSLDNIKLMEEVFVSITIATAFVMATALLLPVVAGLSIDTVVQTSLGAIIFIDGGLFFMVRSMVPDDDLCHDLEIKNDDAEEVKKYFYIIAPISVLIIILLFVFLDLPFLFNFALGLLPLLFVGYLAQQHEGRVYKKDLAFPSFIRALGGVVEVRLGAVVSSLRNLQVHDFGVLDDLARGLYRRLKLGNDKYDSWMYFAVESGSNLIANFSQIFAAAVYMGGNAEEIGGIVSKNFSRLLFLRKLRLNLASSVRGAFYGALVGFAAAGYVSAKITEVLADLFTYPMAAASDSSDYMSSVLSSIAPSGDLGIDFATISIYIGIMILIHCVISSVIIKIVDGGNVYSSFFDLIIMIWIGAVLSWVLPQGIDNLLPGLGDSLNATEELMNS